jgi:hypothetical protein
VIIPFPWSCLFLQAKYRVSEAANKRNSFFKTTGGASKGLEGLKAEQREEQSDFLVECFWICMVLFHT